MDLPTPLWKASKSIACINNVFCYITLVVLITFDITFLMECDSCGDESISCKVMCSALLYNSPEGIQLNWFLILYWQMLLGFMIVSNHKLRSIHKPNINTILLWLLSHGIAFIFLFSFRVFAFIYLKGSFFSFILGSIIPMIMTAEIYVVLQFYAEERRFSEMSTNAMVNVQ